MRSHPTWPALMLLSLTLLAPTAARAQSDAIPQPILPTGVQIHNLVGAGAARLRTLAGPDPDTVYVGKSATNFTAPDNYWNVHTGTYLPGTGVATNAMWDWDNSVGIQAADSLHGWWPLRRQYNSTGGLTLTDDQRPWWAIDHGNLANYVISQQAAAKRTFGVVGLWHADPGRTAGAAVPWTPLSGTKSAWCGLREHGDQSVKDAVTGQPFNQDTEQFLHDAGTGGGGSPQNFPGYPDQIDQILYRDIPITVIQSLTVSFKYRTRMSTSIVTVPATRTGWFHGDPLAVTSGNFISSSAAGANAPQDSFMVYVGVPANDAACVYSDGVTRPVYDKQRRWFSEVLKVFGTGNRYFEIFAATGDNPADTLGATPTAGPIVVPAATINTILGGLNGNVRLAFRVKTNRGFADSDSRNSGYSSFGYGAVQIDDVVINKGAGDVVIGDFEGVEQDGVNAIDNRFPLPAGLTTTDVWRSTGKPPAEYFHVEALSNLTYNDLCGPPNSPSRVCNIGGVVLTAGNHDDGENAGDSRFTAFREVSQACVSPTINLLEASAGVPNSQGITASIASASDDYLICYDLYAGMFNLAFSGESWVFGAQCYPATQPNGARCWGQLAYPGFIVFNPEPQCFTDLEGFRNNGNPFRTSNPSGIPDSVRVFVAHQQQCFSFAISLGCNSNEGGYFDNVSLAFVDRPGVPGVASVGGSVVLGTVSSDIWQWVNDTFPANESTDLPGSSAFDTTTALVRTGLNTAQATGNSLRFDIPGDSSSVIAANATVGATDDPALSAVRVDLVFRILPGPGNYRIAGGRTMPPGGSPSGVLLQVPTNQAAVVASGDASFWGQYIADPGEVSAGDHHGHTSWDHLTWNSARCDTTELNIFPVGGGAPTSTSLTPGAWMSMYHELDPKFTTLGVNKFKCFVIDTTKAASSSPALDNVNCTGVVPAWLATVPQSRTGYDGNAQTKEFSKIIPDGLLTPGSHVEYFYRKSHAVDPLLEYAMCPDTNFITPQRGEGSTDEHRWQEFSVLPDRWKNTAFGGAGSACMLYVDLNDRRGNEGTFVGTLDSIGATATVKRGAHDGWTAPGTTNLVDLDIRTDMSVAVSRQNSQPGTTWDMYGVKAAESLAANAGGIGSRLANRANMGFAAGRESRQGPTPEMLRAYYRVAAILTGDLNSETLGPHANRSQNDIALLNDFLATSGGSAQPRGILVQGDGFGQSEKSTAGFDPVHAQFLTFRLGLIFRSPSYQSLAGNLNDCANLVTTTSMTTSPTDFGVANACTYSNDVYTRNPAIAESAEGAFYENVGLSGPYVADVVKPASATRNWVAVTSGYNIEHLFGQYCGTGLILSHAPGNSRLAYYYLMLNKMFGGICQITGSPTCPLLLCGDAPQSGPVPVDFMKIGDSIMRTGPATVRLGIAHTGRVQVNIYDVAGRKVRKLADRVFPEGQAALPWDGTDNTGHKLPRGVYFVRSTTDPTPGRIIVLNP